MPSSRGVYRGVYSSLVDDPDFQQLSSGARHVLLTMRVSPEIGPACIWRYYLGPIAARCGYTQEQTEVYLRELDTARWTEREGTILWIRNGLRYDPSGRLSDTKHMKSVLKAVSGLPKQEIIIRFCKYYNLPCPFEGPSKALRRPIEEGSSPSPNTDTDIRDPITTGRPFEGPSPASAPDGRAGSGNGPPPRRVERDGRQEREETRADYERVRRDEWSRLNLEQWRSRVVKGMLPPTGMEAPTQ